MKMQISEPQRKILKYLAASKYGSAVTEDCPGKTGSGIQNTLRTLSGRGLVSMKSDKYEGLHFERWTITDAGRKALSH